jgi:hypothetical protein
VTQSGVDLASEIWVLARASAQRMRAAGHEGEVLRAKDGKVLDRGWVLASDGWYFAQREPFLERHRAWWLTSDGTIKIHEFEIVMGRRQKHRVRPAKLDDVLPLDFPLVHRDSRPPTIHLARVPPSWREVPNDGAGIKRLLSELR